MRIIGGDFELDFVKLQTKSNIPGDNNYYYSSGRAALHYILKSAVKTSHYKQIMLPDYLCSSIIDVATQHGLPVAFYPVNESLQIDLNQFEAIYKPHSIVIAINYFGMVDQMESYNHMRVIDSNIYIIEDNVQSYYTMQEKRSADVCFTSFRKTFALPDGGWVKGNLSKIEQPSDINTFAQYKITGGILKSLRNLNCFDDSIYMSLLNQGEALINENLDSKISNTTLYAIQNIDTVEVSRKRTENGLFLQNELYKIGLAPLIEMKTTTKPLFIPIVLKNRDEVRRAMFKDNIFCPIHWPVETHHSNYLKKGLEMANKQLSLIVDQRYGLEDINRIINVLKKAAKV